MSRSYKKPWYKDGKGKDNWYNKLVRRTNKQRVKLGKRPFKAIELVDPYDICDYRWIDHTDWNGDHNYDAYRK